MRNDEKMALESIYADAFTERVPGRVWEIRLELAVMKQYLRQEEKPNPRGAIQYSPENWPKNYPQKCPEKPEMARFPEPVPISEPVPEP